MSDNLDPQQIDELNKNLESLIETLGGTATKSSSLTKSLGEQLGINKHVLRGLSDLGTSATDLTKSLYGGEQGAKAFNKSIDGVSNAIDSFANYLIAGLAFINPLAAAGIFLTKSLVKGAIDYGKAAGEMGDKLYDSYSALSRAGAAGQQGMNGVYTSMQKFAYGIDELDKMLAIVKENSKNLALFSGTVVEGVDALSNTAETIQRSGLQGELLRMGMSVDGINRGTVGYYNQLGRLGQLQGKTQAELTAGTYAYLVEMEGLTRLTGLQREDLEKQRQEANMIDAFFATIQQMGKRGEDAYKIYDALSTASPRLAKQFASQISGFITEESSQIFQGTGGAIGQLTQSFKDGQSSWEDVVKGIGAAYEGTMDLQQGLALAAGAGKDMFGSYYESQQVVALKNKDFAKAMAQTKPMDGLTASAVELRQKQMASRDALQDFVKLGVGPATDALNSLAGAAKSASSSLPGGGNKTAVGGDNGGSTWLRNFLGLGPSKVTQKSGDLLDFIAKGESRGNYNQLVTVGKKAGLPDTADLTNMTIDQVQKLQASMRPQGYQSSAVGKYQIIEETLRNAAKQLNLDTATVKFDSKTQDMVASYLIEQRTKGRDIQDAMNSLYNEWPSLSKDITTQAGKELATLLSGYKPPVTTANPTAPTNTKKPEVTTANPTAPTNTQKPEVTTANPTGPTSGYKPAVENTKPSMTDADKAAYEKYNQMTDNNNNDDEHMQKLLETLTEQSSIYREILAETVKMRQAVQ